MSNHVGIHPHILEVENMTSFIQSCVKFSTKGKLSLENTCQTSLKPPLRNGKGKEPKSIGIWVGISIYVVIYLIGSA